MVAIDWLIQDDEARALLDEMVVLCDRIRLVQQRMRASGDADTVYESDCLSDFLVEIANVANDAGLTDDDD